MLIGLNTIHWQTHFNIFITFYRLLGLDCSCSKLEDLQNVKNGMTVILKDCNREALSKHIKNHGSIISLVLESILWLEDINTIGCKSTIISYAMYISLPIIIKNIHRVLSQQKRTSFLPQMKMRKWLYHSYHRKKMIGSKRKTFHHCYLIKLLLVYANIKAHHSAYYGDYLQIQILLLTVFKFN